MDHVESNAAQRARLIALVERLSDEDLSREIRDGWTVSGMLAHLAYLDRLRLAGWEYALRSGKAEPQHMFRQRSEVDVINDASQPLLLAIPPREAARQAVEAAEAVDRVVESLPPALVQAYLATGEDHDTRMLYRGIHRKMHLDEIEVFLSQKSR